MKHIITVTVCAALLLNAVIAVTSVGGEAQHGPVTIATLPASLDNVYPPNAPAPVYLIEMVKLGTLYSGAISDLLEGDTENAWANYEAFSQQYHAVAEMVPEWKHYYSGTVVDELGQAIKSGDQGTIMGAFEKVAAECHTCHIAAMPATYFKYHWGDFNDVSVVDPLSKQEVSYKRLMQLVESDLSGIGNDMLQDQNANALEHVKGLKQRFVALGEACMSCHDSERKYFVDEEITGLIDRLEDMFSGSEVNPEVAGALLQEIGTESCHKCHLVHVPAAFAKQ